MNDDGKIAFGGELDVPVEPLLLFRKGRAMPVSVEACFSDGNRARLADHVQDPGPILLANFGRVVGVDADGGENSAMRTGQLECAGARGCGCADGNDLGHAFLGSPLENSREVSAQPRIVKVRVGVNQWARFWRVHVRGGRCFTARGYFVTFPASGGRPQSLHGNWLSIFGLLDSPVNVVLNSNPGPGLDRLFVGLGPSGAWLAPRAQDVVCLGGREVPRRCCSYWRTVVGCPSPVSRGGFPAACAFSILTLSCEKRHGVERFRAHLGGDE
jgi:hypothetical protein